jgi:secretion/DNA translocation related TadE-like protein
VSQRGSAAVATLGVAGVVLVLTVAVADVGIYLAARLQAAAAADAAALAAAPVTFAPFGGSGSPVAEAAHYAAANGTRLVSCACAIDRSFDPRTVTVAVSRRVSVPVLGIFTVTATSRAEFAPAALLEP